MNRQARPWTGSMGTLSLAGILLLLGGAPAQAAPQATPQAAPEAAPPAAPGAVQAEIRGALDRFNEASARGDLAAVMASFDDRADVLLVGSDKGEVYLGRAAMEGWLGKLYKGTGFGWQMDRVDLGHHGGTAWVFVEGKMVLRDLPSGKVRGTTPYRFTGVLVKKGEAWIWRLFHGSVPGGH